MASPTAVHSFLAESSRRINTQASSKRGGVGRHKVYASGNISALPTGLLLVAPQGINEILRPSRVSAVAGSISLAMGRIAVRGTHEPSGKRIPIDLFQALPSYLGKEYGRKPSRREPKFKPPFNPSKQHAKRGLTIPQAVYLINCFRIAERLGKPLNFYLPDSEFAITARKNAELLGLRARDADELISLHCQTLKMQVEKIGQKLFSRVRLRVLLTSEALPGEGEPVYGHFTRGSEKIGVGEKRLELARRVDGISARVLRHFRKADGLFVLEGHASGVITNAAPYDKRVDGVHIVLGAVPPVYSKAMIERTAKIYGDWVRKEFEKEIAAGKDRGSGTEVYLGGKIARIWDPTGVVSSAVTGALNGLVAGKTALAKLRNLNAVTKG